VAGSQAINSGSAERSRRADPDPGRRPPALRVEFTLDDLALTRFGEAPAPLTEVFAGVLELRRRPAAGQSRWAALARRAFPATARPLLDVMQVRPPWPSWIDPAVPDLDEALEIVRATPRSVLRDEVPLSWPGAGRPSSWLRALADGEPEALDTVVRALRDFYLACVAPHWPGIVATFRADLADRVAVLATGGLAAVLGTLHDDLTWRDNSLERWWRPGEFSLDGGGLQILPSVLWTGPPVFASLPSGWGGSSLIYPARSPLAAALTTPAAPSAPSGDLAGLLGQTRAAVLKALRTPRGTAELAACVGTSAPSASEHATALRAAGLVTTVRRGRGVNHSLTPLGRSLLNGNFGAY
jgi:DNA-binding transcriptional ArsR family regulator